MLVHANLLLRVRPPWGLLRLLQLLRLLLRGNCVRVQGLYIHVQLHRGTGGLRPMLLSLAIAGGCSTGLIAAHSP